MRRRKKSRLFPAIFLFAVIAIGVYIVAVKKNEWGTEPAPVVPKSPISGEACADATRRPIAVMLSGDAITRPLSGLSEADLVFNMPVITDSITRMMAVYVCGNPKEIGSIRSTRDDYIPLARGLDAILAHWGGSHFALDLLNKGIMDNLDALPNKGGAFYRKSGIVEPHNGFTSLARLINSAKKLNYRLENKFIGYDHQDGAAKIQETKTIDVGFPGVFSVKYAYDPKTNSYLRWRGGTKEIDANNNNQVSVKNVVIMFAESKQIEGQYNTVAVEGQGNGILYQNGEEIKITWKKSPSNQTNKLFFYGPDGKEVKFVTGQIWVEVVQTNQKVSWK